MKKINLKGISETLSKKELRNVTGGSNLASFYGICYWCHNGMSGKFYDSPGEAYVIVHCTTGWMQWISSIEGPEC